ncbi:hypothetical protein MMC25_006370 [Agyrium rufum]|nr:hypothetical protein [Agyrium rufum]
MPHATPPTDDDNHGEADEQNEMDIIGKLMSFEDPIDLDSITQGHTTEKADDAVDYDDEDSLADEEEDHVGAQAVEVEVEGQVDDMMDFLAEEDGDAPDLTNGSGNEIDELQDLFNDQEDSSPHDVAIANGNGANGSSQGMSFDFEEDDIFGEPMQTSPIAITKSANAFETTVKLPVAQSVEFQEEDVPMSKEEAMQKELFEMSRRNRMLDSDYPPAPPENREELLASLWPKFESDTVPRFMDLLPPKKARYIGKIPFKPPKPVNPTKISLALAVDQEKQFATQFAGQKRTYEEVDQPCVLISPIVSGDEHDSENEMDQESDYENEPVYGISWQDLQVLCQNWDMKTPPEPTTIIEDTQSPRLGGDEFDDIFRDIDERKHASKKRKTTHAANALPTIHDFNLPSLNEPEYTTAKIARTVILDLNDPNLLVEPEDPRPKAAAPRFTGIEDSKSSRAAFSRILNQRYNISNDEAYEMLKENHQNKVRSTLGNLSVSHSMPAMRLQWPYYKTTLEKMEARSFHRPLMHFNKGEPIVFNKCRIVKRKHLKGKETKAIFETARDLSLADNSTALLLEYSEEHPAMISNFGMGNRIINYYRRKNMEDTQRPKLDIGETAVLLPQDKSPLSIFGNIDPGEITPALQNSMFRAPIFKQDPKSTDFLIIRNTTGVEGSTWHIRNIDNIQIVGQEFPSVDIPGPHSRKVTTASKNRLKMISYRRIRRNKPHRISVAEVTAHFPESTDMQNRQKMKEFMIFSKEHKEWEMRQGEIIPDEEAIRSMVKPEDVCLLESMQVGQQHLQDAGFSKGDDEADEGDEKEGQSIEQQLAPWYTSRNFIHATQGKAMLQLHGEGDPTGRGEGFSFIKTSMKGGFKAIGESVEDKLDAKKLKDLGGHSYNVAKQQKMYDESIRRIWEAQKSSLSATVELEEDELEDDLHGVEEAMNYGATPGPDPPQSVNSFTKRLDDETMTEMTRTSLDSQAGRILRLTRKVRDRNGRMTEVEQVVNDPRVIKQYLRRRHAKEAETIKLSELKPTGDPEQDKRNRARLEKELSRLYKNQDRRLARDKQKGVALTGEAGSPSADGAQAPSTSGTGKTVGTQRKCANCGQVGHIKTNKKCGPQQAPFPSSVPALL